MKSVVCVTRVWSEPGWDRRRRRRSSCRSAAQQEAVTACLCCCRPAGGAQTSLRRHGELGPQRLRGAEDPAGRRRVVVVLPDGAHHGGRPWDLPPGRPGCCPEGWLGSVDAGTGSSGHLGTFQTVLREIIQRKSGKRFLSCSFCFSAQPLKTHCRFLGIHWCFLVSGK